MMLATPQLQEQTSGWVTLGCICIWVRQESIQIFICKYREFWVHLILWQSGQLSQSPHWCFMQLGSNSHHIVTCILMLWTNQRLSSLTHLRSFCHFSQPSTVEVWVDLPMVRSASLLQCWIPWPLTAVTQATPWMEMHHVYAGLMGSGLVHSPLAMVSA